MPEYLKPIPDWEEHEKPTLPGSASMPWHPPHRRVAYALVALLVGITGGLGGYFLQYFTAVHEYPFNIGGRPFHSWPAFIPVTFECVILAAGLSAILGVLALNGLPMPYHPVFNVPGFVRASHNRFFLCIQSIDPLFDREATRRLLEEFHPQEISEVDW